MSKIISFFTSKSTYLLISLVLILCLVISFQYSLSLRKDNTISTLTQRVASVESENKTLSISLENIKQLRESENNALNKARETISNLEDEQKKILGELENVYKSKSSPDRPLPSDVVRMLDDAYKSGSANTNSNSR